VASSCALLTTCRPSGSKPATACAPAHNRHTNARLSAPVHAHDKHAKKLILHSGRCQASCCLCLHAHRLRHCLFRRRALTMPTCWSTLYMRLFEPSTSSFDTISFSTACAQDTENRAAHGVWHSAGQGQTGGGAGKQKLLGIRQTHQHHSILALDAHGSAAHREHHRQASEAGSCHPDHAAHAGPCPCTCCCRPPSAHSLSETPFHLESMWLWTGHTVKQEAEKKSHGCVIKLFPAAAAQAVLCCAHPCAYPRHGVCGCCSVS
jgi:hypothetical protein